MTLGDKHPIARREWEAKDAGLAVSTPACADAAVDSYWMMTTTCTCEVAVRWGSAKITGILRHKPDAHSTVWRLCLCCVLDLCFMLQSVILQRMAYKAAQRLLFQLLMFMYDTRVLQQSRDCLRMRAHYLYFEN